MNQEEAMKLLLSDRVLMIETLMQIEDKNRNLVPFTLNPIQKKIATESSGRDVIVKPAQIGGSTFIICDFLLDCLTIPGTVAVIISYDEFITGRLLRKAETFYKILSQRIPSIPKIHHNSTYEKTFPDVNSSFYIGSARSTTFGRGETIHDLLLDEYAFWQPGDADRIFASALQRVPLTHNTKVRIMSTPNGEDNDFFETYSAAKEGRDIGKSIFKHHFFPWWLHPEYNLKYDDPFVLVGDDTIKLTDLNPDEDALFKKLVRHGYNHQECYDKLRWRRYKKVEVSSLRRSGDSRLLFDQEYPEDDVSCFLTAGNMVYDSKLINDMARQCYPAQDSHQGAAVWYPPENNKLYLVAVDPGLGKESVSVATVWDFCYRGIDDEEDRFRHCATLAGMYSPEIMAEKVKELARYYNSAVIAGEANLEFVSHIKDYPNLYYREDVVTGKVSSQLGWLTTPRTKPYMITEVNRHMSKILTHDSNLVSQFRNIRWIGDRPMNIGMDDYHDSCAIAIVCRNHLPVQRGLVGTAGWKW
jgi:hypothetical protein